MPLNGHCCNSTQLTVIKFCWSNFGYTVSTEQNMAENKTKISWIELNKSYKAWKYLEDNSKL